MKPLHSTLPVHIYQPNPNGFRFADIANKDGLMFQSMHERRFKEDPEDSEARQLGDSRLFTAAVNAVYQLAAQEGANAVLIAEYLANGGLVAMHENIKGFMQYHAGDEELSHQCHARAITNSIKKAVYDQSS